MSDMTKMPASVPDCTTGPGEGQAKPRRCRRRPSSPSSQSSPSPRSEKPFWISEPPSCSDQLSPLHRRGLEELAEQITEARKIARRLDRSRRYCRRTVARLLDAVWKVTTSTEIVTGSLAVHLAGYRIVERSGTAGSASRRKVPVRTAQR